jgi:hypothetical protein
MLIKFTVRQIMTAQLRAALERIAKSDVDQDSGVRQEALAELRGLSAHASRLAYSEAELYDDVIQGFGGVE